MSNFDTDMTTEEMIQRMSASSSGDIQVARRRLELLLSENRKLQAVYVAARTIISTGGVGYIEDDDWYPFVKAVEGATAQDRQK